VLIGDRYKLVPGRESRECSKFRESRKGKRIRKRGKYERSSQFFLFF